MPEVPAEPPDTTPIYTIEVEDVAEAALLREKLRIEPVAIRGTSLYFAARPRLLDSLRAIGYLPVIADVSTVRQRVVRIVRRGTEPELARLGVRVINREDDHWIAATTLGQLESLRRLGYTIAPLRAGELRPREVRIVVRRRDEVARIGELHVDIYSARDTADVVEVRAGAFDDQIDRMRALGFTVERIGTTPP
jgi:hypothetical protein